MVPENRFHGEGRAGMGTGNWNKAWVFAAAPKNAPNKHSMPGDFLIWRIAGAYPNCDR
jgi:hypothetical protein